MSNGAYLPPGWCKAGPGIAEDQGSSANSRELAAQMRRNRKAGWRRQRDRPPMKRRERPAAKSIAARPIICVGLNVPHPFRVWLSLGRNHEKHQFFACWKAAAAEDDNMISV